MPGPSTIRVLVADDFEPWRRFVSSMLQNQPGFCVVAEVCDGLEAVRQAEQLQPDLILLDIGLPQINGIEAAHRIHQAVPAVKILFTSAISDPDIVKTALMNGASGYMLKPEAQTELLPAIDMIIRGHQFLSARLQ